MKNTNSINFAMAFMLLLATGFSVNVRAGSATGDLEVSATVINPCSISTSTLAFGNYDTVVQASANLDINGEIDITCSVDADVSLAAGLNHAGGHRQMANAAGTEYLMYDLYTNNARTQIWNATNTRTYIAGTTGLTMTVFGRVMQAQAPSSGSYTDVVVVTANF